MLNSETALGKSNRQTTEEISIGLAEEAVRTYFKDPSIIIYRQRTTASRCPGSSQWSIGLAVRPNGSANALLITVQVDPETQETMIDLPLFN